MFRVAQSGPVVLPKRLVIVLGQPRLTQEEIEKALKGCAGAPWYNAIVSKIEAMREDNLLQASRSASEGNTHAMAGGLNVYEALSGLLEELDQYASNVGD